MKHKKVAFLAFLSQLIRALSGPLVILLVAKTLTNEEMSFYYSFLNVVALQQVFEMGIGFVSKQYIAHEYGVDEKNKIKPDSLSKIKGYFRLTQIWFLAVSLIVLIIVGYFGIYFFSSYDGDILWLKPWWLLVIVTSVGAALMPIQILVEGCQSQLLVFKARLYSTIFSTLSICTLLYFGFGLISIAISSLVSLLILYSILYRKFFSIFSQMKDIKSEVSMSSILKEVWPMLSKISLSWTMGYFFWNSFNLIAFKLLPINTAGSLGFTLNLARSGLTIAESLISSQSTLFAKNISEGNVELARKRFEKLSLISILLVVIGYSAFMILSWFHPSFFLFSKALDGENVFWIFTFFTLLLPILLQANFCRCFKIEPYFKLSFMMNLSVPTLFYVVCYNNLEPYFLYAVPIILVSTIWSYLIYKETLRNSL
ncbi:hypothetical protein [Enterovibrio norvegicus]|uniref:Polysaccharide biosynthesis protein n=1 Tax=Enterovibrio norvegicus TaxID=188144 RepID=A0ABV4KYX1_9GAMM|nr:hypothetical protein [Enterovibrio norvegicus]OEF58809.1 hypothetical protein A1OU_11680 [Enterovibrio norvegicus]